MKRFLLLTLTLLFYNVLFAQNVQVSGVCIAAPATLAQTGTLNGKPIYEGIGTISGNTGVPIAVFWDSSESLWFLAYNGQPYFSSPANTSVPPGTASTTFSWSAVAGQPCTGATPLSVTGNVALWVTFGSIDAYVKENNLHVNWTTEKEVNNDHFEIEASTDGEQFVTIGNVQSKAESGNSDITLSYEWIGKAGMSLSMLPYLAFILILLLLVHRKKTVLIATVAISFIAFSQISCKKDKDSITNAENYFIRIAQIDKDGTTTYSKVVRVNGE